MSALLRLNNTELIFFEKCFLIILNYQEKYMRDWITGENMYINLSKKVDEFLYTYKEFINPDVICITNKYEMSKECQRIKSVDRIVLISEVDNEYEKLKNKLSEFLDNKSEDELSKNFSDIADDVYSYTMETLSSIMVVKKDYNEKFNKWISSLSDNML